MASIYKRAGRYWASFVDFGDCNGKCEPLCAAGEKHATKSFKLATTLFHRRIAEYEEERKSKTNADPTWERGPNAITLVSAMERYVAAEATFVGSRSASHWRRYTRIIADAASTTQDATFSFQKCLLSDITPRVAESFVLWLRTEARQAKNGKPYASGYQRKLLDHLHRTLDWAVQQGWIPYNATDRLNKRHLPVRVPPSKTKWYTVDEVGRILQALQRLPDDSSPPDWPANASPYVLEQAALPLYTGARGREVQMQRWEWVDWEHNIIRVWTAKQHGPAHELYDPERLREVPLWPQLRTILEAYRRRQGDPVAGLMFPMTRASMRPIVHEEPMEIGGDSHKSLRAILRLRGVIAGEKDRITKKKRLKDGTFQPAVTHKGPPLLFEGKPGYDLGNREFRHTYCAVRLQTVEPAAGAPGEFVPVSQRTVEVEMGHSSEDMVKRIYGHVKVGPQRRLQHVEYQVTAPLSLLRASREQHRKAG
jgi:integrase